jgi:hypothetical protein
VGCIKHPAGAGCLELFLDRDMVCHRTAVKLSFARLRPNYRQLPTSGRVTRGRPLCRNRLPTGYSAMRKRTRPPRVFLQSTVIVS